VFTLSEINRELSRGLWKSPYIKIYSLTGRERVAEISNYPRAYKDTTPHVYEKDIEFTVAEDDLNHYLEDGEFVYFDSKRDVHREGEKATHWKGDSLPGVFPLWIEDENLPFTKDTKNHIFPLDKVPKPIVSLTEAGLKDATFYLPFDSLTLSKVNSDIVKGEITFKRVALDSDKQILRFKYRREL